MRYWILRPRHINEVLTTAKVTHTLETQLIRQYNGPDVGHGTHLTVYWGRSIKDDHVENYGQNGGQARDRVNL
jgi:hypothetical protein